MSACPNAVDLTDDDFESRYFWQDFGVTIGSRSTGTFCCPAVGEDVGEEQRAKLRSYLEFRTKGEKIIITKNPHLLNKVAFVARIWPEARFVIIVRDALSVVASKKIGFQRANTQNEDHPPFLHYWPEGDLPCWWTVRNDRAGQAITAGSVKRIAKSLCGMIGLKRMQRGQLTGPGKIYRHERLSRFLRDYPDLSRYYPGEGFRRLPEAWLTLNVNACESLTALDDDRWLPLTYAELVAEPRQTVEKICRLAEITPSNIAQVPDRLDEAPGQKWRKNLTGEEQATVITHLGGEGKSGFEYLEKIFQSALIGAER